MTLQDFEIFANQKGLSRIGQIAYGIEGEYPVLIQYLTSTQWRITLTANIPQPVPLQAQLAVQFPKRTATKILCKPDSVAFTLCFHGENPLEPSLLFFRLFPQRGFSLSHSVLSADRTAAIPCVSYRTAMPRSMKPAPIIHILRLFFPMTPAPLPPAIWPLESLALFWVCWLAVCPSWD